MNYIDHRMRVGKRITEVHSGLEEVAELADAGRRHGSTRTQTMSDAMQAPRKEGPFKGGSIEV